MKNEWWLSHQQCTKWWRKKANIGIDQNYHVSKSSLGAPYPSESRQACHIVLAKVCPYLFLFDSERQGKQNLLSKEVWAKQTDGITNGFGNLEVWKMFDSAALVFSFLQNPSSGLQRIHFLPLLLQCFALHFDLHKGSVQSTFHVSWYPSLTLLRKERMEPTAGNIVTLYSLRIQEACFKSNTASDWNQGSLRRWTIKHSVSEFQQFWNHAGRHAFAEPAIRLKRNGL